jgi:hypothetical protein
LWQKGNSRSSPPLLKRGQNPITYQEHRQIGEVVGERQNYGPRVIILIPKYILMQGNKPFADLGAMFPHMKALAKSQDIIGYCNFMEGYILTHFYAIQNFQLAMSSSYLNGANWAKQFISKLLHVTHFQWIFRNISLQD